MSHQCHLALTGSTPHLQLCSADGEQQHQTSPGKIFSLCCPLLSHIPVTYIKCLKRLLRKTGQALAGMRGQPSTAFPAPLQARALRNIDKKVRNHVESPGQCFQLLLMYRNPGSTWPYFCCQPSRALSVLCTPSAKSGQGHTAILSIDCSTLL